MAIIKPLLPVLAGVLLAALSACSSDNLSKLEKERPAEELYSEARTAMEKKKFKDATRLYEEVERQHPYSKWATEAQLMSAFSSYKDQRYDEAILSLDRFIELHPGNERIDYAYYLKALSYYEQISDVRRDQEATRKALDALNTLIRRFPGSQYARDAQLKRDLTLDHLAGQEMEIGRFYIKQGHINAAINRFLNVVKDYQTTTHVPEALHRLVEAYLTLGLKDEATKVAVVLGHNYPGSRWYQDTYKLLDDKSRQEMLKKRSIVDKTVDTLLKRD